MAQEWDISSLNTRRGGPRRLLGMKIYYDFRWADVFPDDRSQFRNGLSLARHALKEVPAGKQPALLLTVDGDADRTPIETDTEYILVVRIRDLGQSRPGSVALDSGWRRMPLQRSASLFRLTPLALDGLKRCVSRPLRRTAKHRRDGVARSAGSP